MIQSLIIPGNEALAEFARPVAYEPNWRGISILMSRKFIMANVTDRPFTLAQFNCLMAKYAKPEHKPSALLYLAQRALTDDLLIVQHRNGGTQLNLGDCNNFALPECLQVTISYEVIRDLAERARNTVMLHLGGICEADAPSFPEPTRLNPLLPEDAAAEWAEAMEKALNANQAQSRFMAEV